MVTLYAFGDDLWCLAADAEVQVGDLKEEGHADGKVCDFFTRKYCLFNLLC